MGPKTLHAALVAAALTCPGGAAMAASPSGPFPPPPVVVELFTSQSCSSCPPADALLAELARTRPDVLALGLHVTYWDRLGWKDPYSLGAATERQRRYNGLWDRNGVYTPQLVAGGRHQAVGSDRAAVLTAIDVAKLDGADAVPLRVAHDAAGLVIEAGAGRGAGTLLLVGYDPQHTTRVAGGENGGRTLTEVNVVRSLSPVGTWQGEAVSVRTPAPPVGARGRFAASGGRQGARRRRATAALTRSLPS